jgi:hypothetical protein
MQSRKKASAKAITQRIDVRELMHDNPPKKNRLIMVLLRTTIRKENESGYRYNVNRRGFEK